MHAAASPSSLSSVTEKTSQLLWKHNAPNAATAGVLCSGLLWPRIPFFPPGKRTITSFDKLMHYACMLQQALWRRFSAICVIIQMKITGFVLTHLLCIIESLIVICCAAFCRTRCSSIEAKSTSGWRTSAWSCSLSSPTQYGWPAQRPLETASTTHLDSVSLHYKRFDERFLPPPVRSCFRSGLFVVWFSWDLMRV